MYNDGRGFITCNGEHYMNDEDELLDHKDKGLVAWASQGKDRVGSQFTISLAPTEWLNSRHTVFGEVIIGLHHMEYIASQSTRYDGHPTRNINITYCGAYEGSEDADL